jgi:hypothetical protein
VGIDFEGGSHGDLGGVLVDVGGYIFLADLGLCDAVLVTPHGSDDTEGPRIHLCATVAHDANDNLLPAIPTPSLAPVSLAQVCNVFDDTVH